MHKNSHRPLHKYLLRHGLQRTQRRLYDGWWKAKKIYKNMSYKC